MNDWLLIVEAGGTPPPTTAPPTDPPGTGYSTLTARHSGKLAQVPNGSTDGAALSQNAAANATNQQWQLRDAGSGYVNLVARHSGQCLDVLRKLLTDGVALGQWACGTGANQMWQQTTT